ncbi:hypothetical protein COV18_05170 [Candidatus Woesearchaeota archaeon CG10_big_fil_rev_8_21_14_0_10_37_12]|nr:MAG: hypothetical protein COV18_05170 [Candidatus Woesearchaeota archaeon CG10_big_fil_rev_8_21_14_0_10_37_12]
MEFEGFILDKFQEDAIRAIEINHSMVVSAPTGSGKTLIADYIIDKELKGKKRVIYTAPIKALSNQKFRDFTKQYGEDKIGLVTGDLVINSSAQILIMTTEVYRNMAVIKDPMLDNVAYCIMDEVHFISDEERGYVWEESIIFSPETVRFLFLSATIPNGHEFADWVKTIKKHQVEVVVHTVRPVPLEIKFFDTDLGITTLQEIKKRKELDDIPDYKGAFSRRSRYKKAYVKPPEFTDLIKELKAKGKLPCIYFVFSRVKTQDYAVKLAKISSYVDQKDKFELAQFITNEFQKINEDISRLKSTKEVRSCLSKGIAFHHAGLLPDVKHIIEKLFGKGLIKVLFATETFAVGINMPAKTVCFDGLRKFTGTGFRSLNSKEFFQIAGRAGRRGMDKTGLAVAVVHRPSLELKQVSNLVKGDTLPLMSQFKLSYNTVLNMVHLHNEAEIDKILKMNFFTFQQSEGNIDDVDVVRSIKARYEKAVKKLKVMNYISKDCLTDLGMFTTKIFSNELEISQMFATKFKDRLDEYDVLLLIGSLVYEPKREAKFFQIFPSKKIATLVNKLKDHPYLKNQEWYKHMTNLSAFLKPCSEGKKFVDILRNANMPEGDVIRFLMQLLDRLEQIDRASDDFDFKKKVQNCKDMIKNCLEGIHVF